MDVIKAVAFTTSLSNKSHKNGQRCVEVSRRGIASRYRVEVSRRGIASRYRVEVSRRGIACL